MGMPPFEFFRLVSDLPVKKLFLRDMHHVCYHSGLQGISDDVLGTVTWLQSELARGDIRRSVFVGNSMGGYAAILFGWLTGVDEVHAFAPITFVGPIRYLRLDWRRNYIFRRMYRAHGFRVPTYDLKRVLRGTPSPTRVHVHYSAGSFLDRSHAGRLRGCDGVVLHRYENRSGHELIRQLRDEGTLRTILDESLGLG